jgi:hypothetical protein
MICQNSRKFNFLTVMPFIYKNMCSYGNISYAKMLLAYSIYNPYSNGGSTVTDF